MLQEHTSRTFLEVGSGYDRESVIVDKQFSNLFTPSPEKIHNLRIDIDKTLHPTHSGFAFADAAHLPFPDNILDLITAKDVIGFPHSIAISGEEPITVSKARRFQFFAEAHRVLRPEGKLILIENNTPDAFKDDAVFMKDYAKYESPVNFFNYFRNCKPEDIKKIMGMIESAAAFYKSLTTLPSTSQDLISAIAKKNNYTASFKNGEDALHFLYDSKVSLRLLHTETKRDIDATFVAMLQKQTPDSHSDAA